MTTVLLHCESLPKHQMKFSLGLQKFLLSGFTCPWNSLKKVLKAEELKVQV